MASLSRLFSIYDDATGDATGWKETHCKTSLSFFFPLLRAETCSRVAGKGREGERGGGGGRSWRGRRSSSGVRVKNRTCTTRGHRHISINEFSGYRGLFPARRAADPELHSQLQSAPARIPPFWESGRNLYVNPESQHGIFDPKGNFSKRACFFRFLPPPPFSFLMP